MNNEVNRIYKMLFWTRESDAWGGSVPWHWMVYVPCCCSNGGAIGRTIEVVAPVVAVPTALEDLRVLCDEDRGKWERSVFIEDTDVAGSLDEIRESKDAL